MNKCSNKYEDEMAKRSIWSVLQKKRSACQRNYEYLEQREDGNYWTEECERVDTTKQDQQDRRVYRNEEF